MDKQSRTSLFLKWLAGVASAVLTAVIIWFITHPGGALNPTPTEPTVIEISGIWYTPVKNLSYNIIQNDNQFEWVVRETMVNGFGTIEGNRLTMIINNEKVIYNVVERDENDNPTVLFTTNRKLISVILFRTCDDFQKFNVNLGNTYPDLKPIVEDFVRSINNPSCP
jgi:hypothetical protein